MYKPMSFETLELILGVIFIIYAIGVWLPFAFLKKRNPAVYDPSADFDFTYKQTHFFLPGKAFGVGVMLFSFGLIEELYNYWPSPKDFWASIIPLTLGLIVLSFAILVGFSKRFNNVYWKYVWHGKDLKRDREYMCFIFIITGATLLMIAYLVSDIFPNWP